MTVIRSITTISSKLLAYGLDSTLALIFVHRIRRLSLPSHASGLNIEAPGTFRPFSYCFRTAKRADGKFSRKAPTNNVVALSSTWRARS